MTDERQNLDSDPSTTATVEPPDEQAATEPAAGEAAAPVAAASAAEPGAGPDGDAQPEKGGEVAQPVTAEGSGGEEGEPLAAVGEVAGAEEAAAAADVAAEAAGEGEAPTSLQVAETAAPVDAGGEAGAAAPPAAAEDVTAAQETPAGAQAPTAAATEGAVVAEPAEAATPQAQASATPPAQGSAAAEPAEAATPQARAEATPTAEAAAAPEPSETPAPEPEANATPIPPVAAAADQARPASSPPDAGTTPAAEGATAAALAEEGQPATPQAAADAASPAAAEAPATAEQPAAAEAAAPAAVEEPEDPALAELREAREKGTPVEGRVIGWNRGGFHVVVGAVTAFCPSSEMEVGRPKSPQSYVEKTFPFKVIKYQKKGRRVVLSRAGLLAEQRQEVLAGLQPGSVVKGRVTSLPDFGAFVDLGGVEGLVHVSEISRSRVQHPKDALQPGQEVEVKVLKVEQGGERISLSMKDLEPDPWQGAGNRFNRGDRFSGKALRKTEFGLFVELEPEVEGLLHVSQLPPGKTLDDPAYQPGQPIEGWVREVEPKRQRISLSLREVPTDDPWKDIAKRFPEGEMVEGVVESIAPFGVFIALAPGVTGLLPNSQTGLPRGTSAARSFAPGQAARVQVISVDARRKRISLGREGTHVEASRNDLQDFKRQEREREKEKPTAMAAAFARLREGRDEDRREER